MSDKSRTLAHTTDRTVTHEVPAEVLAEVAVRTSPDASRSEVRSLLEDHIHRRVEFVTPGGSSAIDAILDGSEE